MIPCRLPLLQIAAALALLSAVPSASARTTDTAIIRSLPAAPSRPVVALLTDFGLAHEAVGLCHGAILAVDPDIRIVDISHNPDAYDVQLGALMLRGTTVFPKGTVFVGVIDPGVGTTRKPVAIRTKAGFYYVGPNNGLLTWVIRDQEVDEAVTLDEKRINPQWEPGTFDGRDLFSPAGALLAVARGDLNRIGTPAPAEDLVLLDTPEVSVDPATGSLHGVYLRQDAPYGNVWTNITRDDVTSAGIRMGDMIRVTGDNLDVTAPLVVSFGYVPEGRPLAYFASNGSLAFALNMANFSEAHGMKPGMRLTVKRADKPHSKENTE